MSRSFTNAKHGVFRAYMLDIRTSRAYGALRTEDRNAPSNSVRGYGGPSHDPNRGCRLVRDSQEHSVQRDNCRDPDKLAASTRQQGPRGDRIWSVLQP